MSCDKRLVEKHGEVRKSGRSFLVVINIQCHFFFFFYEKRIVLHRYGFQAVNDKRTQMTNSRNRVK